MRRDSGTAQRHAVLTARLLVPHGSLGGRPCGSTMLVLMCALSMVGPGAPTLPPIELVETTPTDVSPNAEAFVRGATIYLVTSIAVFQRAMGSPRRCGEFNALRTIASIIIHEEWHVATSLIPCAAWSQSAPAMSRVRSANPMIAQLIADAPAASVTFRSLVAAIDATNGIVYVESGQCRHGARACLSHSIQVAGPNRILRIVVNLRRDRTELIGAIGHELHHSLEVLREPGMTTTQGMFFHFYGMSRSATGRFETKAAFEAGIQIERELRTTTTGAGH